MPLGRHKRKWELASLIMIILLILAAFALVAKELMLQSTYSVAPGEAAGHSTNTTEQTRQDRRLYRRLLNMHDKEDSLFKPNALSEQAYAPGAWMPHQQGARLTTPASSDPLFESPLSRRRSSSEEGADKKEQDEKTGWGWLADEVAAGRREREQGSSPANRSTHDQEEEDVQHTGPRDDAAAARRENPDTYESARTIQHEERQGTMFMVDAYTQQTDRRDASGMRPALRDLHANWSGETEKDTPADATEDGARDDRQGPSDANSFYVVGGDDVPGGLSIRDPFASSEPERASRASWASGSPDAFNRFGAGANSGASMAPSLPQPDEAGFSRPASSGVGGGYNSGLSSSWGDPNASSAAGSMFGTPSALDGSRSDSLFSGSGMFDGNAAFRSPGTTLRAQESTPEPSRSYEPLTPGALPW